MPLVNRIMPLVYRIMPLISRIMPLITENVPRCPIQTKSYSRIQNINGHISRYTWPHIAIYTYNIVIYKPQVWCRGGSRYVEGCWGPLYSKQKLFQKKALCFNFVFLFVHCLQLLFWFSLFVIVVGLLLSVFQFMFENVGTRNSNIFNCLDARNYKKQFVAKCFHNVSGFFDNVAVISKGSEGPCLVDLLEVPKNAKENAICPGA